MKWPIFAQDVVSPRFTFSFTPVNFGVASGASSPASKLFLFFEAPLVFSDPLDQNMPPMLRRQLFLTSPFSYKPSHFRE